MDITWNSSRKLPGILMLVSSLIIYAYGFLWRTYSTRHCHAKFAQTPWHKAIRSRRIRENGSAKLLQSTNYEYRSTPHQFGPFIIIGCSTTETRVPEVQRTPSLKLPDAMSFAICPSLSIWNVFAPNVFHKMVHRYTIVFMALSGWITGTPCTVPIIFWDKLHRLTVL